jgi:hypothetical protein
MPSTDLYLRALTLLTPECDQTVARSLFIPCVRQRVTAAGRERAGSVLSDVIQARHDGAAKRGNVRRDERRDQAARAAEGHPKEGREGQGRGAQPAELIDCDVAPAPPVADGLMAKTLEGA